MHKNTHYHLIHYFFLASILLGGISAYVGFAAYPEKQFVVVIITGILYTLWGIAHHHLEGDLYPKTVIEYTLIAILSIMLLRGVIFR